LYLGDTHAAEDVCQETLLAAWNAAGRTNGRTPLRPWLFGILFNQCRKHRRSLWRRARRELDAAQRRAESGEGHEDEDAERLETLRHAVARLDEALRAVVILRYEQGFGIAETAETLGLPEGTVKSRTSAAIERLRALMRKPL
jgi:RNA polymerase sigma-70 factor (ECF subfamily)